MKRTLWILAMLMPVGAVSVYGHHSFAAYYFEDQSITVEGELQEMQFRSPHVLLMFNGRTPQGQIVMYTAEWSNPRRLGETMNKDTLRPGDRIIVTGAPGRVASEYKLHLKAIRRPADGWSWGGR